MINTGDKIKCSNNHTYTFSKCPGFDIFLLIDETGYELNVYSNEALQNCIKNEHLLCIQNNNKIDYTKIIEYIRNEE